MAERGCGERVSGGIYAECPLSKDGLPIEHFLVDSPIVVDPDSLGITPVGVKLVQKEGVWHVFDWVGSEHYPNVADFVEEVKCLGLSRRLAKTLDFSKLTHNSKIFLIHSKAHDLNYALYPRFSLLPCPKGRCPCPTCVATAQSHDSTTCMCASRWWHNLDGTEDPDENGVCQRNMPSFTYCGRQRPTSIKKPRYKPAIFLRLPIANIAVIRDRNNGTHKEAQEKASLSTLPVLLKDE